MGSFVAPTSVDRVKLVSYWGDGTLTAEEPMADDHEPDIRQRLEDISGSDRESTVRDTITHLSSENGEEASVWERLERVAKMNQEPKDRMWAVIIVVSILVFLLGGLVLETRFYLSEGRTLGFQRGAVDCLTVLVDGDRDFGLPDYCSDPRLVIYYPESVCDLYYTELAICGEKEDR